MEYNRTDLTRILSVIFLIQLQGGLMDNLLYLDSTQFLLFF